MFTKINKKQKDKLFTNSFFSKNRKGVSVMIGYILLITFAVVISVLVYSWLKTYVPSEGIDCPDGISVYIEDYIIENNELTLTFQNNGKFNIGGVYIYYSDDETQEIASKDLSIFVNTNDGIKMNPGFRFIGNALEDNPFETGTTREIQFDLSGVNYIYAIDIVPIRWQEDKNKIQVVSCTNAKTTKIIDKTINQGIIISQEENELGKKA